jgi:hypothetical protein
VRIVSAADAYGRRHFRDAHHRVVPGSFAVSSVVEYLDDAGEPDSDELILVDGWQIGATYRCQDGTWASWGPAGLDRGHPNRQASIDAQVRAYACVST